MFARTGAKLGKAGQCWAMLGKAGQSDAPYVDSLREHHLTATGRCVIRGKVSLGNFTWQQLGADLVAVFKILDIATGKSKIIWQGDLCHTM